MPLPPNAKLPRSEADATRDYQPKDRTSALLALRGRLEGRLPRPPKPSPTTPSTPAPAQAKPTAPLSAAPERQGPLPAAWPHAAEKRIPSLTERSHLLPQEMTQKGYQVFTFNTPTGMAAHLVRGGRSMGSLSADRSGQGYALSSSADHPAGKILLAALNAHRPYVEQPKRAPGLLSRLATGLGHAAASYGAFRMGWPPPRVGKSEGVPYDEERLDKGLRQHLLGLALGAGLAGAPAVAHGQSVQALPGTTQRAPEVEVGESVRALPGSTKAAPEIEASRAKVGRTIIPLPGKHRPGRERTPRAPWSGLGRQKPATDNTEVDSYLGDSYHKTELLGRLGKALARGAN